VDIFATLAAAVGAPLSAGAAEDSVSFLPELLGKPYGAPPREAVVLHSGDGLFAIRKGSWKLVEGLGSGGFTPPRKADPAPGGPRGQLYDLASDPGETRNLYLERPDLVEELGRLLAETRRR
jgi:arylsulfatase A-like enzyme